MIHFPTQGQQPHSRWWRMLCILIVRDNKQILTFVKGMKMFLFTGSPHWESRVKMILYFTKVSSLSEDYTSLCLQIKAQCFEEHASLPPTMSLYRHLPWPQPASPLYLTLLLPGRILPSSSFCLNTTPLKVSSYCHYSVNSE